ncbi:hypothetical protein M758_4G230800 [Ceratodon purpureus]|nr:hypothetical protein M758_4G230800 [Ceratodon purpureus]
MRSTTPHRRGPPPHPSTIHSPLGPPPSPRNGDTAAAQPLHELPQTGCFPADPCSPPFFAQVNLLTYLQQEQKRSRSRAEQVTSTIAATLQHQSHHLHHHNQASANRAS